MFVDTCDDEATKDEDEEEKEVKSATNANSSHNEPNCSFLHSGIETGSAIERKRKKTSEKKKKQTKIKFLTSSQPSTARWAFKSL